MQTFLVCTSDDTWKCPTDFKLAFLGWLFFLVDPFTIFILKQFRLDNFIHQSVEKGISIKTKKEVLHLFTLRILNSLNCTFSRFNSCEKALHLKKTVVYVNLGACFATFYFFFHKSISGERRLPYCLLLNLFAAKYEWHKKANLFDVFNFLQILHSKAAAKCFFFNISVHFMQKVAL